jgi:hypothetical protein
LKKPAGSVRFRFYEQKTKKTEPNRTETDKKPEKKPSQTGKTEPNRENRAKTRKTKPNRFEPVFALKKPNRTEPKPVGLTRFRFGFGFFFKKKKFQFGYFF